MTSAILASQPEISVHFSRLPVVRTGLDSDAMSALAVERFRTPARLLADAGVQVIAWNGSAGSWAGGDLEQRLCAEILADTGIPATTTTFAIYDAFRELSVRRYSLVAPFQDDVVEKIRDTYQAQGFSCVKSVSIDLRSTHAKDRVPLDQIRRLVREAAHTDAEALAVVCTNFRAAPLVDDLERELGLPIVDSVLITAWQCLRALGLTPKIEGWGTLLRGLSAT